MPQPSNPARTKPPRRVVHAVPEPPETRPAGPTTASSAADRSTAMLDALWRFAYAPSEASRAAAATIETL